MYLVSYIDRGNIGNAYTAEMGKAWGITSDDYSWIVTIYYIAYILFYWLILVWRLNLLPVSLLYISSTLSNSLHSSGPR